MNQLKPFAWIVAGSFAVLVAAGCAKGTDQSTQTTTTTTATTAPGGSATQAGAAVAMGDPGRGKQIFSANCTQCHGATGVEGGGIGPSLKGEKAKKNYAQTIEWIHKPLPPMPKLWPSPLGDKDVQDVAAYVQTL